MTRRLVNVLEPSEFEIARVSWVAVRCCCSPQKIFGFLKLPAPINEGPYQLRSLATFTMTAQERELAKLEPIRIQIKRMTGPGQAELAIYSEDRPIEFWRGIEGFVEAKNENAN